MKIKRIFQIGLFVFVLISLTSYNAAVIAQTDQGDNPPENDVQIQMINPYFAVMTAELSDGSKIEGYRINGPSEPFPGIEAERQASIMPLPSRGIIPDFPSYSWVFGCSAVSGAMIAAYHDRNGYDNMYAGLTNGGVMPVTDTYWPTWIDSLGKSYPNNPLVASHTGVDGRVSRGSIDDYWVSYGSATADPYITNSWDQHVWGTAIGDYMKTSQSEFLSTDGSTWFYGYTDGSKLTCDAMESINYLVFGMYVNEFDGTYGRKEFYEARGYTVGDCYNQHTDNQNVNGFSLADFQAEIDAGYPVLLNLEGHSVVGYGYSGSTIYIRDTWDNDPAQTYTMPWGGSYDPPGMAAMPMISVSIVHPELPPPTPSAPRDILASDGTFSDRVRVTWNASSGATTYKIFRNTSDTLPDETKLIGSTSSISYDDMTAAPETHYYYWVQACNTTGCSDYSINDEGWRSETTTEKIVYLPLIISGTGTPIQPIINGGFESGPVGWIEYSVQGWDIILRENEFTVPAYGGDWLAWLGGDDDETSVVSQTITITSGSPYLHYWYWAASDDACGFDYFRVKVGTTTVQTKELCGSKDTSGWVQGVVNLSGYIGTSRILKFEVTTDSSLNSNLFLDDVSLSASASVAGEVFLPAGVDLEAVSQSRME